MPTALVNADGLGEKERSEIRAWIDAGRTAKRPTFRAYKSDGIGAALERLFERKCAYCESLYVATQPIDVEHWRPKAEVEVDGGAQPRHGYEWLAAEWSNLLPSCIDCNRARKQIVLASGTTKRTIEQLSGKANQFPLFDEVQRLTRHDDPLAREDPLLLDPCRADDDGAAHFRFLENGVVVPRDEQPAPGDAAAARRRRRALESIRVYALNRKALVDARKERLLLVLARCAVVRSLVRVEAKLRASAARDDPSVREAVDELATLVAGEVERLGELHAPSAPYSLMARQFVVGFLSSL